ncbi:MAG: TatD family hydrolase [Candidatus Beckwithbacteria bacterium]|nr:TatD family hydrolase [Candidatus Beckwithbacteria bacterium]
MFVDTHCHLNFEAFAKDWQSVVEEAKQSGVRKMILVGTDIKTCQKAIEMARETAELYATIGFHPHHVKSLVGLAYARVQICQITDQLKKLGKNKKVVAIGECGLDYHVYRKTKYSSEVTEEEKTLQKQLFGMQTQLAKELKLPLIIHNREAGEETLDTLNHFCKNDGKYPRGVFHCISGSKKLLKKILEMGFFVGVDGNITYSQEVQELAKNAPLDRILLETDAPYLSPKHDGSRNFPQSVKIVAQFLAKLKGTSINQIETQTTKNAEKLFKL